MQKVIILCEDLPATMQNLTQGGKILVKIKPLKIDGVSNKSCQVPLGGDHSILFLMLCEPISSSELLSVPDFLNLQACEYGLASWINKAFVIKSSKKNTLSDSSTKSRIIIRYFSRSMSLHSSFT